jgi:hypothetical protein
MVRPKKSEAYTLMLQRMNARDEVVECECGKRVSVSRFERHKATQYHQLLLRLKVREEEETKG